LVVEKTRAENAADAAAYSAALVQARALNFAAYTNRAIVANQVAIAQTLSLINYINYAGSLYSATKISNAGPLGEGVSMIVAFGGPDPKNEGGDKKKDENPAEKFTKLSAFIAASLIGQYYGIDPDDFTGNVLPYINAYSSFAITSMDAALFFLEESQNALFSKAGIASVWERSDEAAKQVIERMGDKDLHVTLLPAVGIGGITKKYTGEDRKRLQQVVLDSLDGNTRDRNWEIESNVKNIGVLKNPRFLKSGGASMPDLDHWAASDKLEFKYEKLTYRGWRTRTLEIAEAHSKIGGDRHLNWNLNSSGKLQTYSSANNSSDNSSSGSEGGGDSDDDNSTGCGSQGGGNNGVLGQVLKDFNPGPDQFGISQKARLQMRCHASEIVKMDIFVPVYAGMSKIYDVLNPNSNDPLQHRGAVSVMTYKNKNDTKTAGADKNVSPGGRLALYSDEPKAKELVSVARAEILFKPPARKNADIEYANLFNPYWTVRLVNPTDDDMAFAHAHLALN
jgi:hypothetical protein